MQFPKMKSVDLEENKTYLLRTIFTKIFSTSEYRHKFPVIFEIHVLCSMCMT